jgi:hypothetical protein
MALTYTTNTALAYNAFNEPNWYLTVQADWTLLDGLTALGALCVTTFEHPSTTLKVAVAAGVFRNGAGVPTTYAGGNVTLSASTTTALWLTNSGTLTTGASFPSTAHIRLATVVTGGTTVTSVTDARVQLSTAGTGLGFILNAGDTIPDGSNFAVGTSTGTKIGTSVTQKLGFWNATAIVQPTSSAQAALTNSTTGTIGTTLGDVGGSFSQANINNNFATLWNLVNAIRTALVNSGIIKGS